MRRGQVVTPGSEHVATSEESRPTAGVRIHAVRVRHFRGIQDVCVTLHPTLTLLLGENNSGKTSFLEALGVALGGRRASDDDLRVAVDGQRAQQFVVDVLIEPAEGDSFEAGATAVLGQAVYPRNGAPEAVTIRATGTTAEDGSGITMRRQFVQGWDGCATDDTALKERPTPSVTQRVLDLLSFTLLDARRDLVADLQERRTSWGRLLARLDISNEAAEDIESALQALGEKVIGDSDVLVGLRTKLRSLATALGSSVSNVDLAPLPARVDELARGIDVLVTAPGNAAVPLRMQGMGSRSLAALTVFSAFVEMRLGRDLGMTPLGVTALEEPEAHLHPQGQAAVATLIEELPGQKLVSTHASRIVGAADLHAIRVFRRTSTGIEVRALTKSLDAESAVKVRRLVQRPFGDVLFARVVVLGDGATEAAALPVFARAEWGKDPGGLGAAFPEVGGLRQPEVGHLIALLDDLRIPWVALVDGDQAGHKAVAVWEERLERSLNGAPEIVVLPDGQAFEAHLRAEGFIAHAEAGLREFFGDQVLEEYAASCDHPPSGEELVYRALRQHKGTCGAAVARAICAEMDEDGRPRMPSAVREVLQRASAHLELA